MKQQNRRGDFIEAGYAANSSRKHATCKGCKEIIKKEAVRLSYNIDRGKYTATYWYHLYCFQLTPSYQHIDPEQDIRNLGNLDEIDYQEVIAYINSEKERLEKGEKRPPSQQKPNPKPKPQKPRGRTAKKQSDESDEEEAEEKPSKKNQKKRKQNEKEKQAEPEAVTVPYTPAQQRIYETALQKYGMMSSEDLKQILVDNTQTRSGTKKDMVERCADGKALGQIPLCPKCGGGRPRFNKEALNYTCAGFMEDERFRPCNATFQIPEIKRNRWID